MAAVDKAVVVDLAEEDRAAVVLAEEVAVAVATTADQEAEAQVRAVAVAITEEDREGLVAVALEVLEDGEAITEVREGLVAVEMVRAVVAAMVKAEEAMTEKVVEGEMEWVAEERAVEELGEVLAEQALGPKRLSHGRLTLSLP